MMADEISNRTLAILLIAAIVVSLGGTFFSLNRLALISQQPGTTGFVTNPTGQARVNITSLASLRFSIGTVDFGTGYVNTTAGNQYCSMAAINQSTGYLDGIAQCVGFIKVNSTLQIEDDGNTNLSLVITSDRTPATFIGGSVPVFKYQVVNNGTETGSCPVPSPALWNDLNTNTSTICAAATNGLGYLDTNDSLNINLNISIPYNSLTGQQTATLTVTGTAM
jgi:hypothetical protein